MPEDLERIVRGLFAEWNEHRGELTLRYFDPDIELDTRGLSQPDFQGVYRGSDEFLQWARTWVSACENAQQFPVWVELTENQVVAWVRMHLIGRFSGLGGDFYGGWSFWFRADKIVAIRLFADESEARAELNPSAQTNDNASGRGARQSERRCSGPAVRGRAAARCCSPPADPMSVRVSGYVRAVRRFVIGPLLVAVVVGAGSAGAASPRATAGRIQRAIRVAVPLPAPGHAELGEVTVTARARKGRKLGAVHVGTNDAQLPPDVRIVAVGVRPPKRRASETIKLLVLINRPSAFGSATTAAAGSLDVVIHIEAAQYEHNAPLTEFTGDCSELGVLNDGFEPGVGAVNLEGETWTLISLRPESKQPSSPEEVLDFSVASMMTAARCSPPAETPEAGNT